MNAFKSLKWLVALLLFASAGIGSAWADGYYGHGYYGHGHAHFGVVVGVPWGPWYYPSPYYYPPYPPVVVDRTPPVYVEQPAQPAPPEQTAQAGNWYYCAASKAYYPYVKECPAGWQQVAPQPPRQP